MKSAKERNTRSLFQGVIERENHLKSQTWGTRNFKGTIFLKKVAFSKDKKDTSLSIEKS